VPVFNTNFGQLVGRIVQQRPGADRNLAQAWLNETMRMMLDRRSEWAGLRKNIIVSFPGAYSVGTLDLVVGSSIVVGTGTNFPTNDLSNTVIAEQVSAPGDRFITPGSMTNINRDSTLYIDAAGPNPEILPVLDILGPRIYLNFQYPHNAGASIWQSSLSGLQFRFGGNTTPIYTCICITSPTTAVMDQPWGQVTQTGASYQLVLMYITIDPQIKDIITATDPFQNIDLDIHKSQKELNIIDPNRLSTNSPVWLADRGPNPNGNGLMQYEPWPPILIPYQLNFYINLQWPDMRIPSDYPPPVLNPNCLIYGALSQGFATFCGRPPDYRDPAYSLENAERYRGMADQAFLDAVNADESRVMTMFTYSRPNGLQNLGANYEQVHAFDSEGNFLSSWSNS
jgi:hypothetical protein